VEVLLTVPDYSATVLLAYETARKAALGLLLAAGVGRPAARANNGSPSRPPGHLLTARAARALDDAAYLRRRRNDNMYRQERADEAAAHEAAEITRRLAADVLPALRALLP
jgi:hypothetical protein